jgi:hypothetical protein
MTEEHTSFVVWAVLPPILMERTTEAALKKVGRRMLARDLKGVSQID